MECLFCKIISSEIPSKKIYEDDLVLAFLDINPTTNGDTLIIPKKHYENIMDIDLKVLDRIYEVARKLYPKYKEKLGCDGVTLSTNTEYGQEIKHCHFHFIPRYKEDEVHITSNKNILLDLDKIKDLLND